MHSVTSGAVASYAVPKIREKTSNASFVNFSNWGLQINENGHPSTSQTTWQPMINVNYTQDNKHNSAGFYKNMFCVGNADYQTSVFLCDMTTLGDNKPFILKYKTVAGITNVNGVLWSGNSNLDGTENIICAYPPSGTDYKVAIGKGTGCWVQLLNYDGTRMGNVQINIDIYYF